MRQAKSRQTQFEALTLLTLHFDSTRGTLLYKFQPKKQQQNNHHRVKRSARNLKISMSHCAVCSLLTNTFRSGSLYKTRICSSRNPKPMYMDPKTKRSKRYLTHPPSCSYSLCNLPLLPITARCFLEISFTVLHLSMRQQPVMI